jgi:hypothetical protein
MERIMDHEPFDELARSTAGGASRRTLLRLLAGSTLGAAATRVGFPEDVAAKHKKRKKKGARCMTLRKSCAGGRCCGSLGCGDNGCDGGAVCYQHEGGSCGSDCDCRGDLYCSERKGDTCQDCGYPETPCITTANCCLQDSICGYNGCASETVCCQWEIGTFCYDNCDCCAELGCFGNACLPLFGADGAERQRGSDNTAEQRPAKDRWPRREATGKPRQDT